MTGLPATGTSGLGVTYVCGLSRVPFPAGGMTTFRTAFLSEQGGGRRRPGSMGLLGGAEPLGSSASEDRPPTDIPSSSIDLAFSDRIGYLGGIRGAPRVDQRRKGVY